MNVKTLQERMNQTPCGERLLAKIVNELEEIKNNSEMNLTDEELANLDIIKTLGEKLLMYNYYKQSEKCFNEISESNNQRYSMIKWTLQQEVDAESKRSDYLKFFRLLVDNLEDWC